LELALVVSDSESFNPERDNSRNLAIGIKPIIDEEPSRQKSHSVVSTPFMVLY
jgi:hypothetical protein